MTNRAKVALTYGGAESNEAISMALETLEPKQRELIRLRYFEGLTWQIIAEEMRISVAWTYHLHVRALAAFDAAYYVGQNRV